MAMAIAARTAGDDYQARLFWLQACRLLLPRPDGVEQVGFETGGVKAFDDVVTYYVDGHSDEDGLPLRADYFQVKYHVDAAGALTVDSLCDPAFVSGTSFSILQRLLDGQREYAPDDTGARFILYSNWDVDPRDELAGLVREERISWRILARGGGRARMGRIREKWRHHLELESDEELRVVLQALRIRRGPDLRGLGELLNDKLQLAGLRPASPDDPVHPYDDLTRKLLRKGQTLFGARGLEAVCRAAGLWTGHVFAGSGSYKVGIRTFTRATEYLDRDMDAVLSLWEHFDGRRIRRPEEWQSVIMPAVADFLRATLSGRSSCELHLHAHLSVAFAAGYCLDPKTGVDVTPVQSTAGASRQRWHADPRPNLGEYESAEWSEEVVDETGADVALAISLTYDVAADVRAYVDEKLPHVRRVVSFRPSRGPGPGAVRDGTHALWLAGHVANFMKTSRTRDERRGAVHVFAAAPGAFMFFLGQLGRSFGRCTLYEYDFDSNAPGAYEPSITFPNEATG